jgi:hypothetical protein
VAQGVGPEFKSQYRKKKISGFTLWPSQTQKINHVRKSNQGAGGVAQGVGPEFKPHTTQKPNG